MHPSSSSLHTTPFAQQSPPPRKNPSRRATTLNPFDLSSSTSSAFNHPTPQSQTPRSPIPIQWTIGAAPMSSSRGGDADHAPSTRLNGSHQFQPSAHPSSQSTTTTKLGNNILNSHHVSSNPTTKNHPSPKKLSSITNFLPSPPSSSDPPPASFALCSSPPSVVSLPWDSTPHPIGPRHNTLVPSIANSSRPTAILPNTIPSNSDHGILDTRLYNSSLTPTDTTKPSSFSSSPSLPPSVSQFTIDSQLESLEDEHNLPTCQLHLPVKPPTPPFGAETSSAPASHSFHHLPPASQSSIHSPSQHHHHTSPQSPEHSSHLNHTTPSPVSDLPFACPSPVVHTRRLQSRPTRPVPTRAPPLPRSQTPSLVIRPKFSPCSQIDLSIQPVPSHLSSNVAFQSISSELRVDIKECPVSDTESHMIRDLTWGPSPTSSSSPTLARIPGSSASSIDFTRPDIPPGLGPTTSADLFSTSCNPSSSPPRQVNVVRTKAKKFRDRFTLTNAAPLKISKRQKTHHSDLLLSPPDTGRRIVSGLLNALSPTSSSHAIGDAAGERRKAEFKKTISYPVLNHTSGGDTLSNYGQEDHEDHTDCYNLTIEAAVSSLEGIGSNRSSPHMVRHDPPNLLSGARPPPTVAPGSQFAHKPDASIGEIQDDVSQAWQRKLRRRISAKCLSTRSSKNFVGEHAFESDCPSSGVSTRSRGAHKQLRNRASARLRPLLRRVSSLSLRPRTYASENDSGLFEPDQIGNKVDELSEEEELVLVSSEELDRPSVTGLHSGLKPDSRFRWIRSSISKKKIARSVPPSALDLTTPRKHQNRPAIPSSQSIREKRMIFEPEANNAMNDPRRDLPCLSSSSLSDFFASSDHSASRGARLSTDPPVNRRSSTLSQRQPPRRKPTPAEIKLKDGARSVKALVSKFEHQSCTGSDSLGGGAIQRTWHGGRTSSSTGFVRNSLASIWSGCSSNVSQNPSSTRGSKQLAREQRRKRRGWSSSGYLFSDASEGGNEGETFPTYKLKKKKNKKRLKTWSQSAPQRDDSSFSSFGCDLQERDEEDYEIEPISDHTDLISDHTDLTDSHELSDHHLGKRLSTSSKHRIWPTRCGPSSPEASGGRPGQSSTGCNRQHSQSSSNDPNAGLGNFGSCDSNDHIETDHDPRAPIDQQLSEPEHSHETKTWSLLSSEQIHTILEPQTVWMGDGSQRKILVAGGRLQMAKKIPFPSFEDDAEFSQPVTLEERCSTSEDPSDLKPVDQANEQDQQSKGMSSFLRTRKFDDDDLEEDEDAEEDHSDDCCMNLACKLTEEDSGSRMMRAIDVVSLQDSPTHGRGRRSLARSILMSTSERSRVGNPDRPSSIPRLFFDPPSDLSEKNQHRSISSCNASPNSIEIKQMYLSVDRCQGLGTKMFGSLMSVQHHQQSPSASRRWSGRRSVSIVESRPLFQLTPHKSRPRSQPVMSISRVNLILEDLGAFGLVPANQSRSPLISTSSQSSILRCDLLHRAQNESSTAITDSTYFHEGISVLRRSKSSNKPVSSTQLALETPRSITDLSSDDRLERVELSTLDVNHVLKIELARLQRVQTKWRKFCLEVEDVLKKSRERWPDLVEPEKVLGDFCRPTTKSTFDTFLLNSRQLHRDVSVITTESTRLPQYSFADANSQLTPPSMHPFGSRPITPSTVAGYPSLNDNGRVAQRSPHVVTLPVPSAFVSPEKFLGVGRNPQIESERGPRVLKISHRSHHLDLRQHTLSNRLGAISFKPAADRHPPARMISATRSNGSFAIGAKSVLAEKSINQSPVTVHHPLQNVDIKLRISSSPKIASDQSVKLVRSLGKTNGQENEGSSAASASLRETKKPWRRSALNPNSLANNFHGATDSLLNFSFTSQGSSEEVGVLVADGDQPHEFCGGFHTSGSLRLKHLRRLNQSRSDRSIGKATRRIHAKSSKTELGVNNSDIYKKTSLPNVKKLPSENNIFINNHVEPTKKKSHLAPVPLINHRI